MLFDMYLFFSKEKGLQNSDKHRSSGKQYQIDMEIFFLQYRKKQLIILKYTFNYNSIIFYKFKFKCNTKFKSQ